MKVVCSRERVGGGMLEKAVPPSGRRNRSRVGWMELGEFGNEMTDGWELFWSDFFYVDLSRGKYPNETKLAQTEFTFS